MSQLKEKFSRLKQEGFRFETTGLPDEEREKHLLAVDVFFKEDLVFSLIEGGNDNLIRLQKSGMNEFSWIDLPSKDLFDLIEVAQKLLFGHLE